MARRTRLALARLAELVAHAQVFALSQTHLSRERPRVAVQLVPTIAIVWRGLTNFRKEDKRKRSNFSIIIGRIIRTLVF